MFVEEVAAACANAVISAFDPFVAAVVPALAREGRFAGSGDLRQKAEMVAGAFHGLVLRASRASMIRASASSAIFASVLTASFLIAVWTLALSATFLYRMVFAMV